MPTLWLLNVPEGAEVVLHPVAFAGWLGLFVTSLNLLPIGQLDGGHTLYAATGRLQWRLAWPLWGALALAGFLWSGWWLWTVLVGILGVRHPPVRDETTPLDPFRRGLALVGLLLFVVCFMPVPIRGVPVGF